MSSKVVICGINTAELPRLTQRESLEMLEKLKAGDKVELKPWDFILLSK